jgi:hypothetical protein
MTPGSGRRMEVGFVKERGCAAVARGEAVTPSGLRCIPPPFHHLLAVTKMSASALEAVAIIERDTNNTVMLTWCALQT